MTGVASRRSGPAIAVGCQPAIRAGLQKTTFRAVATVSAGSRPFATQCGRAEHGVAGERSPAHPDGLDWHPSQRAVITESLGALS